MLCLPPFFVISHRTKHRGSLIPDFALEKESHEAFRPKLPRHHLNKYFERAAFSLDSSTSGKNKVAAEAAPTEQGHMLILYAVDLFNSKMWIDEILSIATSS